jgi:hypothetical protein
VKRHVGTIYEKRNEKGNVEPVMSSQEAYDATLATLEEHEIKWSNYKRKEAKLLNEMDTDGNS